MFNKIMQWFKANISIRHSNYNCLDWAIDHKTGDETIVIGKYTPVDGTMHAWLRDTKGQCRDNMRHFHVSDKRYNTWKWVDTQQPDVLRRLKKGRVWTKVKLTKTTMKRI